MSDYKKKKNYSVGDEVVLIISKRCTRLFHGRIMKVNEKSYRVEYHDCDYDYKTHKSINEGLMTKTVTKTFVLGMDDGWMSNK